MKPVTVTIAGRRHRVDLDNPLGQGGEAYVVDLGNGQVLKLYRRPDDPQYQGDPGQQAGAAKRLTAIASKLAAFPRGLPQNVIAPIDTATDATGSVVGYTMACVTGADVLARVGQPKIRQTIPGPTVLGVLRSLYGSVAQLHASGVVVGDFNAMNVLVRGTDAYLIDADSYQFGTYLCATYTTTYVDPLVCSADPQSGAPVLTRQHSSDTDWYAYTVMLTESLLCVGPYGGTYQAPKGQRVTHVGRPMVRATVWSQGARYPRPAEPWRDTLPDDLMDHLYRVFQKDQRGAFPSALLDKVRYTSCTSCGTEHARSQCPRQGCAALAPAVRPVTQTTTVRGTVTATVVYRGGVVVRAEQHGGQVMWLHHDGAQYRREDGTVVLSGPLDRRMRWRLARKSTYAAMASSVACIDHDGHPQERYQVQTTPDGLPVFATNATHLYWCDDGALYRDERGPLGEQSIRIGEVIGGQTRFWTGDRFGFGFGIAGGLTVAFVFDAERVGLNDRVPLRIQGRLLDGTCSIAGDRAWFLTRSQEGARAVNRCTVVDRAGTVVATAEADDGDGSWLGSIRGGVAVGNLFLSPTDHGIVRVEAQGTTVAATRDYPDTEPFVDVGCQLLAGTDGLYVVSANRREITRLKIQ